MENLQKIKPKTLSDDKYAFMQDRWCALDFITSSIILLDAFDINMPSSFINMKNLFQSEMDEAKIVSERPIKKTIDTIKDLEYKVIPMNLYDISVFNSIASTGEDIFWSCNVILNADCIELKASGMNYFIAHKMPKTLEFLRTESSTKSISFIADYQVCYYLYQMFKNVTKTKPKNLLINWDNLVNVITFTDEERSFYIQVYNKNQKLEYKHATMIEIQKYINSVEFSSKGKIDRKESGFFKDSLFKHLTKCLNDTLDQYESPYIELYKNELTKVYIFKKRQ